MAAQRKLRFPLCMIRVRGSCSGGGSGVGSSGQGGRGGRGGRGAHGGQPEVPRDSPRRPPISPSHTAV